MLNRALLLLSCLTFPLTLQAAELAGKLWSIEQQRFIDWPEFYHDWLAPGGWLIVGEAHDNPDHHRIEAELIANLADRGQLGNVALEMATAEQQDALDSARGQTADSTPEQLNWSSGWDWALYQAPVQTALRLAPRVLGADLTRAEISAVYRQGAPGGELEPAHSAYMRDLLYTSHCRQLPKSQLDPMRQVQLARDQQIASVLRRQRLPGKTGILLTGSIHARADLGVPRWLDTTAATTLLLQSLDRSADPASYQPDSFGNLQTADLILFTPPVDAPDYCSQFQSTAGKTGN